MTEQKTCDWCNQQKTEEKIYGYQEDEDEKGNVIPRWICKSCYIELFCGGEEEEAEET